MKTTTRAEESISPDKVNLFFDDENKLPVAHYVRGAITWPHGKHPGYMIVAGQTTPAYPRKPDTYVFNEFPFWTIGTWREIPGFWSWLRDCYSLYLCMTYFCFEDEAHERFYRQINDEALVKPKPQFIKLPYSNGIRQDIDRLITEHIGNRTIYLTKGKKFFEKTPDGRLWFSEKDLIGALDIQVEAVVSGAMELDDEALPGLQALRALIYGYEKFPWREPVPDEVNVRSYWR